MIIVLQVLLNRTKVQKHKCQPPKTLEKLTPTSRTLIMKSSETPLDDDSEPQLDAATVKALFAQAQSVLKLAKASTDAAERQQLIHDALASMLKATIAQAGMVVRGTVDSNKAKKRLPEAMDELAHDAAMSVLANPKLVAAYDPEKGACLRTWVSRFLFHKIMDYMRLEQRDRTGKPGRHSGYDLTDRDTEQDNEWDETQDASASSMPSRPPTPPEPSSLMAQSAIVGGVREQPIEPCAWGDQDFAHALLTLSRRLSPIQQEIFYLRHAGYTTAEGLEILKAKNIETSTTTYNRHAERIEAVLCQLSEDGDTPTAAT